MKLMAQPLASLALSALQGEPQAISALSWLASNQIVWSSQVRVILEHSEILRQLQATKNAKEFGELFMKFYQSIARQIPQRIMAAKPLANRSLSSWLNELIWGPIAVMRISFEEKFRGIDLPEVHEVRHDIINGHVQFLTILTEDLPLATLHNFARRFAVFDSNTVNLQQNLSQSALLTSLDASKKGILVSVDVPDDLYYKDASIASQMAFIVGELVKNAVKYHDSSKSYRFVRVRWDERFAAIIVEDNGIGIDKKQEVWQKRYRETARHPNSKIKGDGFGLAIVKERIVLLRGEIVMQSKVGKGTTHTIRLPQGDIVQINEIISQQHVSFSLTDSDFNEFDDITIPDILFSAVPESMDFLPHDTVPTILAPSVPTTTFDFEDITEPNFTMPHMPQRAASASRAGSILINGGFRVYRGVSQTRVPTIPIFPRAYMTLLP
jgi:signal transduction histidine kinase